MLFLEISFEDIQRHIAGMPLGPMAPSLGVVFETEKNTMINDSG